MVARNVSTKLDGPGWTWVWNGSVSGAEFASHAVHDEERPVLHHNHDAARTVAERDRLLAQPGDRLRIGYRRRGCLVVRGGPVRRAEGVGRH